MSSRGSTEGDGKGKLEELRDGEEAEEESKGDGWMNGVGEVEEGSVEESCEGEVEEGGELVRIGGVEGEDGVMSGVKVGPGR